MSPARVRSADIPAIPGVVSVVLAVGDDLTAAAASLDALGQCVTDGIEIELVVAGASAS